MRSALALALCALAASMGAAASASSTAPVAANSLVNAKTPAPDASIDRWAVLVAGSNGYENYRHQR